MPDATAVTERSTRLPAGSPIRKPSFDERWKSIERQLLAYAKSMCRSAEDAEDAVQEVRIRAWRFDAQYDRSRGSFFTWCRLMLRHYLSDKNRNPKQPPLSLDCQQERNEGGFIAESLIAPDDIGEAASNIVVETHMKRLVGHERAFLDLLMKGHSVQEIARRLGMTQDDAYAIHHSLRQTFSVLLTEDDPQREEPRDIHPLRELMAAAA